MPSGWENIRRVQGCGTAVCGRKPVVLLQSTYERWWEFGWMAAEGAPREEEEGVAWMHETVHEPLPDLHRSTQRLPFSLVG